MSTNNPYRLALATALALVIGAVSAGNPHFVRGPTSSIDNDGDVTVKWKEAGLAKNQGVHYVASAYAEAIFQCVNRGGNCPAASNKQGVTDRVTGEGDFIAKNGQITASLTFGPPDSTLVCPGSQRRELVSVLYTDIGLLSDSRVGAEIVSANPSEQSMVNPECP